MTEKDANDFHNKLLGLCQQHGVWIKKTQTIYDSPKSHSQYTTIIELSVKVNPKMAEIRDLVE